MDPKNQTALERVAFQGLAQCGLNADWCVSAYYIGERDIAAEVFVIDSEERLSCSPEYVWYVVVRTTEGEEWEISDPLFTGTATAAVKWAKAYCDGDTRCPDCGAEDICVPAEESEWYCFTCEKRWAVTE